MFLKYKLNCLFFSIRSAGGLHWFAHGADSFDFYDETDETGLHKCSPRAYNLFYRAKTNI